MQYLIPSIISLDSSNLHLFKNQGTCGPGSLELLGAPPAGGTCGFPKVTGEVFICLSENVDPSILVGLILDMQCNPNVSIVSCTPFPGVNNCGGTLFECTVNPPHANPNFSDCLLSILCSDGTIIDECAVQNACGCT